jgi:hypothetical protein
MWWVGMGVVVGPALQRTKFQGERVLFVVLAHLLFFTIIAAAATLQLGHQ